MQVGWVSDEWFRAIADATVELTPVQPATGDPSGTGGGADGDRTSGPNRTGADVAPVVLRSGPSGAVFGEVEPGEYEAVVAAPGHGPKRAQLRVDPVEPVQIRLLGDQAYGYCWPKWTRAGGESQLRVHAPVDHEITLWRHGWEREQVAHVGHFGSHPPDATRQVLPDGDIAALGARWCANWSFPPVDPRLAATAPDRSGLYWFHLKDRQGRHTSWPWVVAPAEPTARIAVLASTLTWNAYNDWGGRSNYTAAARLAERPSVYSHQEDVWFTDPARPPWDVTDYDPLSFDRPEPVNAVLEDEEITDPIVSRGAEHVAPAEWRLIGWMEREGFAHDVWADAQLATGELPLDAYDVLVISTHPEYWTVGMLDTVLTWVRDRGGKLAYLGGNGINGPVELSDDGTALVALNGRWSAEDTTTRMENLLHASGGSEAALLGVVTTMTGYETGAPYRVLAADHWAFAGTGLRDGDRFGHASLDRRAVGGASGHETDKRNASTPEAAVLLAKGTNPDDGGGEMLHIPFEGGGEVFSVGSISYTCSIAVDPVVSQVTANVLRHFLA